MPEPPAEPAPRDAPPDAAPREPFWLLPEVAWPLALVAGFGGTWLGIRSGLTGLPALLATGLAAPVLVRHLALERRLFAALLACLWILGITGAVAGQALESGPAPGLFPGSAALVDSELGFLGGGATAPLATLPRNLAVFLVLVVLARPLWGILALLGSALVAGALATCAATWAVGAVADGWTPSLAALAGLPPHLFLALLAAQGVFAALAEPGLPRGAAAAAGRRSPELRKALLWSAAGLAGLALGLQVPWIQAWRSWIAG